MVMNLKISTSLGGIRFYNKAWGNKSNTTLLIKQDDGQTVVNVITYILNLSPEREKRSPFYFRYPI